MLEELHELFENDIYAQTYGTAFTDKIEELALVITQGITKTNEFKVFALEAGLGKSKYTNHIIRKNLYDFGNNRKYLVVKKFKEDVEEMEKALAYINPPKGFEENPNVLGITSENWSDWKEYPEKLKRISVIIITHKRYIDLCINRELRQHFTTDREVLIIDEKVNFPMYSFSESYYDKLRGMLPSLRLKKEFDKVCESLLITLEEQEIQKKENQCVRVSPKINQEIIDNFLYEMELNLGEIKSMEKRNSIQHFIEGIQQWYSTMGVYNGGNITTFNREHKLWGLKNNIILDASASVDGVYGVSEHYQIVDDARIIDHSNSKFYHIPFNTSKSNLLQNEDKFYPEIAEKIQEYHKEHDQTLIVCHKDNYKKIQEQLLRIGITDIHMSNEPSGDNNEEHQQEKVTNSYAINWFGNLIGKNAYSNFTQCWIIGTPNIPYEQYLMHYMMYAKKNNLGNKKLDIEKGVFKNDDFRKIQIGFKASEIYQSIKRIQRNQKPNADFFIVNSGHIISLIFQELNGIGNKTELELDFVVKQKEKSRNTYADTFIEHFKKLSIGEYTKKEISGVLKIKHLYRVIQTDKVKSLIKHGYIKINHHTIEKIKNW